MYETRVDIRLNHRKHPLYEQDMHTYERNTKEEQRKMQQTLSFDGSRRLCHELDAGTRRTGKQNCEKVSKYNFFFYHHPQVSQVSRC